MTGWNLLERYGALSENPEGHISAGTSVPRVCARSRPGGVNDRKLAFVVSVEGVSPLAGNSARAFSPHGQRFMQGCTDVRAPPRAPLSHPRGLTCTTVLSTIGLQY
jgi:hypothetical protein